MKTDLHVVSGGSDTPYPVTAARVTTALENALGEPVQSSPNGARFAHAGEDFAFNLVGQGDYMSIRSTWDTLPLVAAAQITLFSAVNTWNHDHFFPTVYWRQRSADTFQVVADMISTCRHGLSDMQLEDEVHQALESCCDAIGYVRWALERMDQVR